MDMATKIFELLVFIVSTIGDYLSALPSLLDYFDFVIGFELFIFVIYTKCLPYKYFSNWGLKCKKHPQPLSSLWR